MKKPEKKYRIHNQHLTAGDFYACDFCGAMGNCKCYEIYNEAIDEYKRYHEWVIKDINATERGKTKKFICELYKLLQCGSFGRVIEEIKRLQKQKG